MVDPLIFRRAFVLCYRIFDVADEISLESALRLLAQDTRRLKLSREGSEYLLFANPPLSVELGKRSLGLRSRAAAVDVLARIFDHGAISVILRVPVAPSTSIEDLVFLADELYDSPAVDELAREQLEGLRRLLAPVFEGPHLWEQSESYTIIFAEEVDGHPTAAQLVERGADLARLLLGEREPLSDREVGEVIQHRFSYRESDLAVVDWNSAFVYEPSGSPDIPDVLEICNAQLLELRYYDDVLDGHIRQIYEQVRRKHRGWWSLFRSPYRLLARRAWATLLEVSEFIERVENSLKIIGDFYLARVYEAAVRRLRIPVWQSNVTRKQQILAQVYQLLKGEVDTDRSLTLEVAIVILIISELLLALASLFSRP
ncbi:MAG TPA: hypothetical protein VKB87_15620 [Myxococcaceae bacterium]|nr:hypothetical protein [Myxococcaceae bacterium]